MRLVEENFIYQIYRFKQDICLQVSCFSDKKITKGQ